VTDAGVAALASRDTGLKAFTRLSLHCGEVTDKGVAALASKDTGLKALNLAFALGRGATDKGMAALSAKDTGLTALTRLTLDHTKVRAAGVAKIKNRFTRSKVWHF